MASANSNIQLTELDFDAIKRNLINYLKGQDVLKDADYTGSVLSNLLDVFAYNTHYNAYYLNMIANEMFLDTAVTRSSVISNAKLLGYSPKSTVSCSATVDITVGGLTEAYFLIPKYTKFLSESIDGTNYTFVTTREYYQPTVNGSVSITDITLTEGEPVSIKRVYYVSDNPTSKFKILDKSVDLNTLEVYVQKSSTDTTYEIFKRGDYSTFLDGTSNVYFVEETSDGFYQIYFGNGIIGKSLIDGNVVNYTYIISSGIDSYGASSFALIDPISVEYFGFDVTTTQSAIGGGEKESIESIKFQAPKMYSAQKRAVTKDDYIAILQQNNIGVNFDAVNVWGGQENDPPVYGQVYFCIKPAGGYTLTQTQKQRLIQEVISPVSVMTVNPVIVDPDYIYIKLNVNVMFDQKKTNYSPTEIQNIIKSAILNFSSQNLNTFNSTFSQSELSYMINNLDQSIIANEISIQVQKKIYPNLNSSTTYKLHYGVPLKSGMFFSGINSYPSMQFKDLNNPQLTLNGVYIEEIPAATGGVSSILINNPGYGYQRRPTVSILGDGSGATAEAEINLDGTIKAISILTSGNNYTSAIVNITPATGDTTGTGAGATAILEGQYGRLRTYYNNTHQAKTILDEDIGTVDYINGTITLSNFNPIQIDDPLGTLTVSANPTTSLISSSRSKIITIDPFDPNAIIINVTAKY